jgi:hypothetical protein
MIQNKMMLSDIVPDCSQLARKFMIELGCNQGSSPDTLVS